MGEHSMSKRLEEKLEVARIILRILSRESMRWTPLVKAVLEKSPTPAVFRKVVMWLLERGYIERPRRGLYRITEKGLQLLKALDQ